MENIWECCSGKSRISTPHGHQGKSNLHSGFDGSSPAPVNLPLIRGQAGAGIPPGGSRSVERRELFRPHPDFLAAAPAVLPRICSSPRCFSVPVAHPGVRKCQKPSEGNRGSRRDLGCPSSIHPPPPFLPPSPSLPFPSTKPRIRGPLAQPWQSQGINPRFRNKNKPWTGWRGWKGTGRRRTGNVGQDFGGSQRGEPGFREAASKFRHSQHHSGLKRDLTLSPTPEKSKKIHFFLIFPCAELLLQPPQKQHKTGFSGFIPVFNIPGHAALLPQPARVPGACSPAGRAWDLWHKHLQVVLQGMLSLGSLPGRHQKSREFTFPPFPGDLPQRNL